MTGIEDFLGRWLVTRADSVHVTKGCHLVIEPSETDSDTASFQLHALWAKEASFTGEATLQGDQLRFTVMGTLPSSGATRGGTQMWQFCATVMTSAEGRRFLFCLALQGDPHAAGVFGAEEDGSGFG